MAGGPDENRVDCRRLGSGVQTGEGTGLVELVRKVGRGAPSGPALLHLHLCTG